MRPQWLDQGLVMLTNHEPLTFIIRRGKQRAGAAQQFAYEHTEEFVHKAAAFGITCLRTHYYKGGGMEYEAPEMRQTAQFIKLCHKHGIRVQGYVQHGTISYETMFLEEPRYRKWLAMDQYGIKSSITYGYQFFRYKPCFNQPGHVDYLKKVVRKGIADGLDMFGFDNSAWSIEPVACQCPACKAKFHDFLNRKYLSTAAGRKAAQETFAMTNFSCVEPPNWHRWAMPINLFEVDDPMIREWVDFKCECMKENIAEIGSFARKLKPDIVLEWNCYTAFGDNGRFWAGVDTHRNMPHLDVVYNEQDPHPGINADGILTTMIPSLKLFKGFGKCMIPNCNYHGKTEEDVKLSMAENLAFNSGNIGMLPGGYRPEVVDADKQSARKRYIDFAAANRDLFNTTQSVADVAVLESYDTLAYTRIEPHHSLVAVNQMLISGNVQYDILTLDRLKEVAQYKVVILPNVKLLSDAHAALLLDYVRNGGKLLTTEQTGVCDSIFRRRESSPLTPGRLGKGEIRHIAKLDHPRTYSYKPEDWYIDPRLWGLPRNHKQFIGELRQMLGRDSVLQVKAPFGCVTALLRKKNRYFLHLLNYQTQKKLSNIALQLRLPNPVKSITLMSPEEGMGKPIASRTNAGVTTVRVAELKRYKILVIET